MGLLRVVLGLSLVLAGCAAGHDPEPEPVPVPALVSVKDEEATATFPDVAEDTPFSFATLPVCVDSEGEITVTGVTIIGEGLSVSRFATADAADLVLGADYSPLEAIGVDPEVKVVTTRCDSDVQWPTVAVELLRTGSTTGRAEEFEVHYKSDDVEASVIVPVTVVLCAPDDTTTEYCDPPT